MSWNPFRKKEERNFERTGVSVSASNFFAQMGWVQGTDVVVNTGTALGVPAVWAAVNFISGTIAGLPLQLFKRGKDGRVKQSNNLSDILNYAVNDEMSSFEWLKYSYEQTLTGGRSFTFIERNRANRVMNFWPLVPHNMTIKMVSGKKTYHYTESSKTKIYQAREIIDIPFMLKDDLISHRSPIMTNKDVIGKAIAVTKYGSKIFDNGGVPPFALVGGFKTGEQVERASKDLQDSIKKVSKNNRSALPLPAGMELKPLGIDPDKMQLTDTSRFMIEEVARIYSIPPAFLQDLTHGTFSNTEQQDLQFTKHTIKRWVEQAEAEINLKLFGRKRTFYVEFNLDGLLRGDLKTRFEAYAAGIQNAFMLPDEAREFENFKAIGGKAGELLVQGATVPLESQTGDNQNGG